MTASPLTRAGALTAANHLVALATRAARTPEEVARATADGEVVIAALTAKSDEVPPGDLRDLLVELIPAPRAPEHVRAWPQDEQDLYDRGWEQGLWSDFSGREQALDLMRRRKVADAVLVALDSASAPADDATRQRPLS